MDDLEGFSLLSEGGNLGGRLDVDVDQIPVISALPCDLLKLLSTDQNAQIVRKWLEDYIEPLLQAEVHAISFRDWNRLMMYYWKILEDSIGSAMTRVTLPLTSFENHQPRYQFSQPLLFNSYAAMVAVTCRMDSPCNICHCPNGGWCDDSFYPRLQQFKEPSEVDQVVDLVGWDISKLQAWAVAFVIVSIYILDHLATKDDIPDKTNLGHRLLQHYKDGIMKALVDS